MTFGSLFTGIGGLDLALEAFGHEPLWQAECDPYARAVLAKHWPGVHCYRDVKEIDHEAPPVDIICGGFPCQDISNAGKRAGIDGERSGLWGEFARIIRVLRPRFVFVENVAALTVRGLDRVLGDLAALGFDAEWDVLRASDVGAPHLRARIFILAHAQRDAVREQPGRIGGTDWAGQAGARRDGEPGDVADAVRGGQRSDERDIRAREPDARGSGAGDLADAIGDAGNTRRTRHTGEGTERRDADRGAVAADVPDPDGGRREFERGPEQVSGETGIEDAPRNVADRRDSARTLADAGRAARGCEARPAVGEAGAGQAGQRAIEPGRRHRGAGHPGWDVEPDVGRVVTRLPTGVDGRGTGLGRGSGGIGGGRDRANRLRCLGNAVVWQQAALAFETLTARTACSREAA